MSDPILRLLLDDDEYVSEEDIAVNGAEPEL
jgi:hypothetical protein